MANLNAKQRQTTVDTVKPVEWTGTSIQLLDQSKLPWEEVYLGLRMPEEVARAIRDMRVRGAPAIGVTAAYGLALAAVSGPELDRESAIASIRTAAQMLGEARPTAVNLRWALERMLKVSDTATSQEDLGTLLVEEAQQIHRETLESDLKIAELGATLVPMGAIVLTHCNTGALATAGYGTALGVIRRAWEEGRVKDVLATETRPWLQGARLTTWELTRMGIPYTLIVDSAAGYLMTRGQVQCVIVGADRIAANGDVANKIGTCSLAILAHEQGIPFYVAAPTSTVDMDTPSGDDIPIEERPPEEVTQIRGTQTALEGTPVLNLAFDVTPSRYVDAIITEQGVARAPYTEALRGLVGNG